MGSYPRQQLQMQKDLFFQETHNIAKQNTGIPRFSALPLLHSTDGLVLQNEGKTFH